MNNDVLPRRAAVWVFVAFASAYFLSALLRAITATLSPGLTVEFGLHAQDLGLLAGGYFLGFAATQLPMGHWLDQRGPKKVVQAFLGVAVLGCLAFAWSTSFSGLLLARVLIGVGVSACLMAPLTGYRRWLVLDKQQRANSWMLMTGSLGMLASTLPVQWLLPLTGWRWMFVGLAFLLVLSMWLMRWQVPEWRTAPSHTTDDHAASRPASKGILASYSQVWQTPYFRSLVPMGFFSYGGLIAMQTLWAGPWMVKVAGYTPLEAATGLFWVNVSMLVTFWLWGLVTPSLYARGFTANQLMTYGVPINFCVQLYIILSGADAGALSWALFCISSSFVALSQPAVGLSFPPALAGRALSAYNLVLFLGVFVVQWGIGLMIDAFKSGGLDEPQAFRASIAVFLVCCIVAYAYFLKHKSDRR
ncbi:MFS transporter [Limnohabitans sp. JirII-31]|uniref:MFS transporter n=1 Tax=Limnohabitans sp. JirII-31 TaxID=1977908 RepID=UPI000C1DF8CB|nr:MFS transporter [Limnohabitans sp. JirII-31]PIT74607.1 MFS transporter [Limnohabitans sp. JirII-31]